MWRRLIVAGLVLFVLNVPLVLKRSGERGLNNDN